MPRSNPSWSVRTARAVSRLRHRRDAQWLVLYLGAAWIIYESVALTVDTFELPVLVARITAVALALGAVASVPLARWYELMARAVDESEGEELRDIPGVPDALEPALAGGYRKVGRRSVLFAGAGSTLLFGALFIFLWSAWAEAHARVVRDPRVSVVVFPFRAAGPDAAGYGEALADLLIATLDGTPGIRVSDPAAIWLPLRPERGATARAPEPDEALSLSRRVGAERFVTGSVLPSGSYVNITVRAHSSESGEPIASLTATTHEDSLAGAVHRLTIDLVASIWEREQLPTVPEIDRYATDNADALKAYLEAKSLARRGRFAEAEPVIERAVALDSTFALAHLEHFNIRSWLLYMNGEPFLGLREIIERAMLYRERLTPRNRMRVEASRALDDTDGSRAAFLYERILSIDSLDIGALHALAFTYLRDGWQLRKRTDEIVAAYDRVLRVDSTSIVARATRARLAMLSGDPAELQREAENLRAVDTTSALALGMLGSLQALLASGSEVDSVLRSLAARPVPVVIAVVRELRTHRPALAERYLDELMVDSMPVSQRQIGSGVRVQLWLAEGRVAGVDSLLQTGEFSSFPMLINRHLVAALLTGVGDSSIAARAIADLTDYLPADSLAYYFYERPTWSTGWAVGAYQATFGDTTEASDWQRALESLPGDGTPLDYRASLSADIEARLAVRRGDLDAAERQSRFAYAQWGIHSNNLLHDHPELAMRFHMAQVFRARGATERAEWLYRSFVPPHSWVGFYTPRASFELGRIEEARGHSKEALDHYLRAMRLWERGEPEVVGRWLARTREALNRLRSEVATS